MPASPEAGIKRRNFGTYFSTMHSFLFGAALPTELPSWRVVNSEGFFNGINTGNRQEAFGVFGAVHQKKSDDVKTPNRRHTTVSEKIRSLSNICKYVFPVRFLR